MLSALGLNSTEEMIYRRLVSGTGATMAQLAQDIDGDPSEVDRSVEALICRGLVVADPAGEIAVAPPAVALGALVRQRQDELRSAELELAALIDEYRERRTDHAAGDLVEVITDLEAVRHRFAQIQEAARHEIRTMVVPNMRVVPSGQNATSVAGLRRGVRYRAIADSAMLSSPGGAAVVSRALEIGEEVRILDQVPVKMVIADDDVAMVPLRSGHNTDPESVLIRASGLVQALGAYFEATWVRAYPVTIRGDGVAVLRDGLDAVDSQLLTMLLAGLTDQAAATQLNMSLRSVQRRIAALMSRAGANTRIQLGWHAARHGWA